MTAPDVSEQRSQFVGDTHLSSAPLLWDPILHTLTAGYEDAQRVRLAQANRLRVLTSTGEHGFGLPLDHPTVAAIDGQLSALTFLERQMRNAVVKQFRAHPLYPWVKTQRGVAELGLSRLLAEIHDPFWNDLQGRARTVGELFAFCGVAGPGQRRARGVMSGWNPEARARLWTMALATVRGDGPYRAVYDAGRVKYAGRLHTASCIPCGVKGGPALPGSPWRLAHEHAASIRLVMRAILRDLWRESRSLHAKSMLAGAA